MKYPSSSSPMQSLPYPADIVSTWRDAPPPFSRPSDNLDAWLYGMRAGIDRFDVDPSVWSTVATHYYLTGDVKASLNATNVRWPQSWLELELSLRMYVLGARDRETSNGTPLPLSSFLAPQNKPPCLSLLGALKPRRETTSYERWFENSKNRLLDRETLERLQFRSGGASSGERQHLAFARATYDAVRSASAHSGSNLTSPAFDNSGGYNSNSSPSFAGKLVWPTTERALRMYRQGYTYVDRAG